MIGGGNTAIDVAREALRLGAEAVTLVYRRSEAEMPAYPYEVAEARAEGVRFQLLADPVRILGSDRVEAVECRRMRLGDPTRADGAARSRCRAGVRPPRRHGREGDRPAAPARAGRLDRRARARPRRHGARRPATGQTSNPKFFAGGDVVNGGVSAVEAVRDGKRAAHGIDEWLR